MFWTCLFITNLTWTVPFSVLGGSMDILSILEDMPPVHCDVGGCLVIDVYTGIMHVSAMHPEAIKDSAACDANGSCA